MWVDGTDFKDLNVWNSVDAAQAFQHQTVTKTVTMTAGQVLDFSIDPNGASNELYGSRDPLINPNGVRYLGYNLYDTSSYTATMEQLSAVPEPSMMVIGTLLGLGGLVAKRRMKK